MKKIYCLNCGRLALTTDEYTEMLLEVKCKKCNKLVVYNGRTGFVRLDNVPERKQSSGVRFY